jgi:Na+-translocating ferredoxin:NAD+ oxidoreductase RnfG subunit
MTEWSRWASGVAAAVSLTAPAYAVEYLTIPQAQKLAFPAATRFVEAQSGRIWKAQAGDRPIGVFIFDRVIGKHLYIDYAVALDPNGRVHRVEILQYRESYGGEVREEAWLSQFVGKTGASPLEVGNDIRNISGATLSSHHVTEGVKRILSAYENRPR